MIWVAKRRRNLFDILIGRPKGYFDPRTWPKDHPDYGIHPIRREKEQWLDQPTSKSESKDSK